jgi:hypothetical protein
MGLGKLQGHPKFLNSDYEQYEDDRYQLQPPRIISSPEY